VYKGRIWVWLQDVCDMIGLCNAPCFDILAPVLSIFWQIWYGGNHRRNNDVGGGISPFNEASVFWYWNDNRREKPPHIARHRLQTAQPQLRNTIQVWRSSNSLVQHPWTLLEWVWMTRNGNPIKHASMTHIPPDLTRNDLKATEKIRGIHQSEICNSFDVSRISASPSCVSPYTSLPALKITNQIQYVGRKTAELYGGWKVVLCVTSCCATLNSWVSFCVG
jgi:hypothetical protein